MTTVSVVYQGQLRTQATHQQSKTQIITDAPVDNHGKGESFSPTDMVASALASCMMTIMAIKAEDLGVDLVGTKIDVEKIMATDPRRIKEIKVDLYFQQSFDEKTRTILERSAKTCPVAHSLSSDLVQTVTFHYAK